MPPRTTISQVLQLETGELRAALEATSAAHAAEARGGGGGGGRFSP